jgi:hypothetical protein
MTWPVTPVATGDLVTSAQLNSLPIILAEANGAAASYTFASIPQVWTHLVLIASLQTGAGATLDDVRMTFNGNSAANYYEQFMRASTTTNTVTQALASTSLRIGSVPGQAAGGFSTCTCWIPNYSVAQIHSFYSQGFAALGLATGNLRLESYGGLWNSAAAITSITLTPSAGSFVAGSIATLYAVGTI